MEKHSDGEIIEGLKNRDNYIVSYLYRRYTPMIRFLVRKYGGSETDINDLFQEGIYSVLVNLKDPGFIIRYSFKTYFYTVCQYQLTSQMRKKSSANNYLNRMIDNQVEDDFSETFDDPVFEKVFWENFEKLDKLCKTILKLFWREISLNEISDILGNSYGYVRKRKSECQKMLIDTVKTHPSIRCVLEN